MEMCYSGALVMPSSYAVMDEEEMMYLEGGAYYEGRSKMGVARDRFAALTTAALAGIVDTAILALVCCPLFSLGTSCFGHLASISSKCYNKLDKWIASSKYTKNSYCYVGMNVLGILITDFSVSLTSN